MILRDERKKNENLMIHFFIIITVYILVVVFLFLQPPPLKLILQIKLIQRNILVIYILAIPIFSKMSVLMLHSVWIHWNSIKKIGQ